jgi:hypothetical protein
VKKQKIEVKRVWTGMMSHYLGWATKIQVWCE